MLFVGDARYGADELHVDLDLVAGVGLLVALRALFVALVALVIDSDMLGSINRTVRGTEITTP